MDFFKRKKVTNQERASNLTLEQLKQFTDVRFEEIYDYLDKVADIDVTKYRLNIASNTANGAVITLPCNYRVGNNSLTLQFGSELLIKASSLISEGHYFEVGNFGDISNKIQLTSDWGLKSGDILIIFLKGGAL